MAIGLVLAWAAPAAARGPGLRVGDLVIHPTVLAGFAYDTNFFYESESEVDARGNPAVVNDAALIKAGLGLQLANRTPNKVGISFDSSIDFRNAVSVGENADGAVADRVVEERNGVDRVVAGLNLAILPRSVVTLELDEKLKFSDRPAFDSSVNGFRRIDNSVGPDLRFRPGDNPDSRAFEMRLGYRFLTTNYADAAKAGLTRYERQAHDMRFLTEWRFLPKTTALADFHYTINDFQDDGVSRDRDSTPFRAELGLRGLVTKRVSVELLAGFLNTFNADGESYGGVVGTAQVQYVLEPSFDVALRYEHDAKGAGYSNFVILDKVSARATLNFLERFELEAKAAYGLYDYATDGAPTGAEKRTDPIVIVGTSFAYNLRDWLQAKASWLLETNQSDYEAPPPVDEAGNPLAPGTFAVDLAEYSRQVFLVQVSVTY